MAKFDTEKITQLMVERAGNYASPKTQAKELTEMTGLLPDVAEAFFKGLTSQGASKASHIRGYPLPRGHRPRKKTPP